MPVSKPTAVLISMLCAFVLSACKVDVTTDVKMANDGTGMVTVTVVADADVVNAVPDLTQDLAFQDALDNGWEMQEPILAGDGSMTVVMTHPFASEAELANVLKSVGPPLENAGVARTSDGTQVTNAIDATLQLANGYASFADSDLVTAAGGVPFAAEIEAAGVPPEQGFSFTLNVDMPGRLITAPTATQTETGLQWVAPTDGTALAVRVETVQKVGGGGGWWARPVSLVALGLLIAWTVFSVIFIIYVAYARRQRSRNRQHALRRLSATRERSGRR